MTTCKSCGAAIEWAAHHKTGKRMPMQLDIEGTWVLVGGLAYLADQVHVEIDPDRPRYSSHFSTCAQAASWRGPR